MPLSLLPSRTRGGLGVRARSRGPLFPPRLEREGEGESQALTDFVLQITKSVEAYSCRRDALDRFSGRGERWYIVDMEEGETLISTRILPRFSACRFCGDCAGLFRGESEPGCVVRFDNLE